MRRDSETRQFFRAFAAPAIVLLVLGLVVVGGCGEEAGRQGDTVTVIMRGGTFEPAEITIEPGVTVRWVNQDQTAHTSTAEGWQQDVEQPLLWNSMPMNPGESFERTFDTVGIYDYFCMVHQSYMHGKITVAEEGGPEPTDVYVPESTTTTAGHGHGGETTTTAADHGGSGDDHGEMTTTTGGDHMDMTTTSTEG